MSILAFDGFEVPKSNYFKVPNIIFDLIRRFDLSQCQERCLLYLLRHTWGFQEYGIEKHITLDEFANGRKKSDGTRMDAGIGMSPSAVSRALLALDNHKLIKVRVDDTDKGRVKKWYVLNIAQEQQQSVDNYEIVTQPCVDENQLCAEETPPCTDANRTEKETLERNLEKETNIPAITVDDTTAKTATVFKLYERWIDDLSPRTRDIVIDLIDLHKVEALLEALQVCVGYPFESERGTARLAFLKKTISNQRQQHIAEVEQAQRVKAHQDRHLRNAQEKYAHIEIITDGVA